MTDPETLQEWQIAVDGASALLALHAAVAYGLVTGGPKIDFERCVEILRRGAAKKIIPRADAVENLVNELRKQTLLY